MGLDPNRVQGVHEEAQAKLVEGPKRRSPPPREKTLEIFETPEPENNSVKLVNPEGVKLEQITDQLSPTDQPKANSILDRILHDAQASAQEQGIDIKEIELLDCCKEKPEKIKESNLGDEQDLDSLGSASNNTDVSGQAQSASEQSTTNLTSQDSLPTQLDQTLDNLVTNQTTQTTEFTPTNSTVGEIPEQTQTSVLMGPGANNQLNQLPEINQANIANFQLDEIKQDKANATSGLSQSIELVRNEYEVSKNPIQDLVDKEAQHSYFAQTPSSKIEASTHEPSKFEPSLSSPNLSDQIPIKSFSGDVADSLHQGKANQVVPDNSVVRKSDSVDQGSKNAVQENQKQLKAVNQSEQQSKVRTLPVQESIKTPRKLVENVALGKISSTPKDINKAFQIKPIQGQSASIDSTRVNQNPLNYNHKDLLQIAQMLRANNQLIERLGKTQVQVLAKRFEQVATVIDASKSEKNSMSVRQLTRTILTELVRTVGQQEALKILRASVHNQSTTITEKNNPQAGNRVTLPTTQSEIMRLASLLRTNEALNQKFGTQLIQNLSKRVDQMNFSFNKDQNKQLTNEDRQKLKILVREIRQTLGEDGDKLLRKLSREIQLRNNPSEQRLPLTKQLEIQVSTDRTQRILTAMRTINLQINQFPDGLQRLIAVYLMQQIAQYRTAQDLIAMVEEINSEWAAMLKEKDIEMLLRAGIEVADSDSTNTRRKRRIISRALPQDISDQRRMTGKARKQAQIESMTSVSKNAAKIEQSAKAETSSPIAELIISRVKGENKKSDEEGVT